MPEYSVVGKRVPRVDALAKVTGSALYSADISLPNMLYGKVLCPDRRATRRTSIR
jgi:CO/xanthine dehydrogenase Mo-binding subunit